MQQLVLKNIPMDLSNFIIIHCLPKEGQHALCMFNSVLSANLYSAQGKGLGKTSLNQEQTCYFQLH